MLVGSGLVAPSPKRRSRVKELVCAFARTFNPLLTVERLPQVLVFPGCHVGRGVGNRTPARMFWRHSGTTYAHPHERFVAGMQGVEPCL